MKFEKGYKLFLETRRFFSQKQHQQISAQLCNSIAKPKSEFDLEFYCDPANRDIIENNIRRRKGIGNIDKVLEYSQRPERKDALLEELSKLPNTTDPNVLEYGDEPRMLKTFGRPREFEFKPKDFQELAKDLKLMRKDGLGPVAGQRSYILIGQLAELEEALIHYTVERLLDHNFKLVSVPDILPISTLRSCGVQVNEERSIVYNLDSGYGNDYSLSGTAEMGLANKLINTQLSHTQLPLKMAAVSRCFRAEASSIFEERGIYRVHQFTKVEMFVCSDQDKSKEYLEELQNIQEELFSSMDLHYQVMDMPSCELGAPAYRKIDIEAWMPGRKQFGELSSCSNCTDYQSRRLNIKYNSKDGQVLHVHTLNGTACAIPRMLIAICETHQTSHGRIMIPKPLIPYMNNKNMIKKQPLADMRVYKYKPKVTQTKM